MARSQEIPKELEDALQRVMTLEKLEVSNALRNALDVNDRDTELHAAQIYAQKEKEEVELEAEDDDDPFPLAPSDLANEVENLKDTLLNHKLVKESLQQASLKIQMQEVVSQNLAKVDMENLVEDLPVEGALIAQLGKNAQTCSELAAVMKETRELDKEILQLRLKYTGLVSEVKEKWEAIESNRIPATAVTPEIAKREKDLHNREDKCQLLVAMVQGLVCGSGIHWGKHQYYITLLKLCDSMIRNGSPSEQDQYIKDLPHLREQMLHPEKETETRAPKREALSEIKQASVKKFLTSTPKLPKHK